MKKSILFVIPSLEAGGGEKSLVNLLNQIDYNLYDIDLVLFKKSGVFINALPKEVNILDLNLEYNNFVDRIDKSIISLASKGRLDLVYSRIMFTLKNKMIKNVSKAEQYTWKYISKSVDILPKKYDVAIGYLEKSSIYFVVDKVIANKKIGWIHTNYDNSGMDPSFDKDYFKKLNNIITVSDECRKSLENNFEVIREKIEVISNIVSPTTILELSNEEILTDIKFEQDHINIVTVGRLSYEKGIDMAVGACELLKNAGYKIKWNVIGDGEEKNNLICMIEEKGLKEEFELIGIKRNPYPYIKKSDIYVQPSRYEGKSIAIDEAKILNKPIVTTNYETVNDQISNNKTGIIVEKDSKSIYEGIKYLIEDKNLQQTFIDNLSKQKLGTEKEIKKIYKLIEGK